jgi:hypothetical protein
MPGMPPGAQTAGLDELTHMVLTTQSEAAKEGKLTMWVIYDKPKDFPEETVARRHEVPGGPTDNMMGGEVEFMRDVFRAAGLVCIGRQEGDDAKILETWI